MKEVTLDELKTYIDSNPHITWGAGSWGSEAFSKPGSKRMKYLYFCLDTRDMKIFRLEVRGMGENIELDFRDEGDESLIEALDKILKADV